MQLTRARNWTLLMHASSMHLLYYMVTCVCVCVCVCLCVCVCVLGVCASNFKVVFCVCICVCLCIYVCVRQIYASQQGQSGDDTKLPSTHQRGNAWVNCRSSSCHVKRSIWGRTITWRCLPPGSSQTPHALWRPPSRSGPP
jgi:hypothetical protein